MPAAMQKAIATTTLVLPAIRVPRLSRKAKHAQMVTS